MKKKITIFSILTILCISLFTGCADKRNYEYSGKDDIQVNTNTKTKMARISIDDTYKKDGVEYFVFTTDVSGNKKFTLSKDEYDTYIGMENNAVDCTIYNLNLQSTVATYSYLGMPSVKLIGEDSLWDIFENIKDIETYGYTIPESDSVSIKSVGDTTFDYDEFKIAFLDNKKSVDVVSNINISQYSFMGESNFSDEEVNTYVKLMDNLNTKLVTQYEKQL